MVPDCGPQASPMSISELVRNADSQIACEPPKETYLPRSASPGYLGPNPQQSLAPLLTEASHPLCISRKSWAEFSAPSAMLRPLNQLL